MIEHVQLTLRAGWPCLAVALAGCGGDGVDNRSATAASDPARAAAARAEAERVIEEARDAEASAVGDLGIEERP